MTAYWIMFLFPCLGIVLEKLSAEVLKKFLKITTAIFFIFFIGLRFEVGGDWFEYQLRMYALKDAEIDFMRFIYFTNIVIKTQELHKIRIKSHKITQMKISCYNKVKLLNNLILK